MGVRNVVLGVAFVLTVSMLSGCGEQNQYEEEGGQYGGGETTSSAEPTSTGTGGFSEKRCLKEAGESGDVAVEISDPGDVPSYEVAEESETDTGKEFEVLTQARSQEDLKKVAEDIRYENRSLDAFSIDFYNEADGGERQDAGLALVFNTREAACRAFQYPVEEQDQIASESNGITVLSVEEGV